MDLKDYIPLNLNFEESQQVVKALTTYKNALKEYTTRFWAEDSRLLSEFIRLSSAVLSVENTVKDISVMLSDFEVSRRDSFNGNRSVTFYLRLNVVTAVIKGTEILLENEQNLREQRIRSATVYAENSDNSISDLRSKFLAALDKYKLCKEKERKH